MVSETIFHLNFVFVNFALTTLMTLLHPPFAFSLWAGEEN